MENLSTEELVKFVKDGHNAPYRSREALGILYDRHQAQIFHYLMFRLNNQQQAEDLTGEVFVRMLKALPGYQERKIPFEAWLYRIARNLLIDEYRKERIRQSVPLHEMDHILGDDADHEKIEAKWTIDSVRQALLQIEPSQREVIELRFLMGLSAKDAALVLDKTVHAVKALQHRGLHNLRMKLQEMDGGANEQP